MKIAEVMTTDFRTLRPENNVEQALREFARCHVNILPLVDKDGRLMGIITRNRLVRHLAAGISLNCFLEQIMVKEPVCLYPDYDTDKAREILSSNGISHAPVINPERFPIGIISSAQIIAAYKTMQQDMSTHLKILFDNLHFGLLSVNKENIVTTANALAMELLSPAIVTGKPLPSIPPLSDFVRKVLTNGSPLKEKCYFKERSLFVQCFPLLQNMRPSGVMLIIDDLTKIEHMSEELRITKEREETLGLLVEMTYDGLVLVDNQGKIAMVNKGFCDLMGLPKERLVGLTAQDLLPNLGLTEVLQYGAEIQGMITIINGRRCLVSSYPLKENNQVIGGITKVIFRGLKELHQALEKINLLEKRLSYYEDELKAIRGTKYTFSDIVGTSSSIKKAKSEAIAASRSMSTVLLVGESGTGKELFAHSIHAASALTGSFIKVNCAAIPQELLEAELFGYDEGAFTGARKGGKKGKFELAHNGTLFLDEIGDMPLPLQAKILRVLQEKEIERVGGTGTIPINVRIIAATNKELEKLVEAGKFREDLYYRLNVLRINIPPLRERREDIPVLINYLIDKLNKQGFNLTGISPEAMRAFMHYNWPGNIRELQNILERAGHYASNGIITLSNLPEKLVPVLKDEDHSLNKTSPILDLSKNKNETEKQLILAALAQAKGNRTKASELLGISRTWLYAKMRKYGILGIPPG